MAFARVLSEEGLENIATHKYVSGKYTPLDNLLNDFWFWATGFLPIWMAPNLVTLLGLSTCSLSYAILWCYCPDFSEIPPRWTLVLSGVTMWIYQTLDAMDGKQARRTGSSSPLGQLFDHGCDATCTINHHAMAATILLPGPTRYTLLALLGLQTCFFLAQWQEWHTHVLQTAMGPIGVTETQYFLIFLSVGAAFVDQSFFTERVDGGFTVSEMIIIGWVIFVTIMGFLVIRETLAAIPAESRNLALSQLIPITMVVVSAITWPSWALAQCPRLFILATGILTVFVTLQMIVASMARSQYPLFQPPVLIYCMTGFYVRSLGEGHEKIQTVHQVLLGVMVVRTFSWVYTVIGEICGKLNIECFRIKPVVKKE